MKKIRKIIILLFVITIVSGCTVKYKIEITDDLKIKEKIEVAETNEKFEILGTTNQAYIDTMYDIYSTNSLYKSHKFEKIIGQTESGIKATKEYKNFEEYLNNNQIRKSMFRFINISEENNIITYSATHFRYQEIFNENEANFPYDTIEIIIELPFEVIETNADEINENGEYIWKINEKTTQPEIKIKFKNKLSLSQKIKKHMNKYIMPVLIGSGIIITLFLVLFINHKRVNKI